MKWEERIIAAHTAVTDAVSHYERLQSERYFVWQEYGRNDLIADGRHMERVVTGTTDLFTKQENDPWIAEIEASFDTYEIAWGLNSVQYEPDTGFIHYEWMWEVCDSGKDDN